MNKTLKTLILMAGFSAGSMSNAKSVDIMTERFPTHMEDASTNAVFTYDSENLKQDRAWNLFFRK